MSGVKSKKGSEAITDQAELGRLAHLQQLAQRTGLEDTTCEGGVNYPLKRTSTMLVSIRWPYQCQ